MTTRNFCGIKGKMIDMEDSAKNGRVLSRAGLATALGKNRATNLSKFLSEKSFQPSIPNDLIASLNSPKR